MDFSNWGEKEGGREKERNGEDEVEEGKKKKLKKIKHTKTEILKRGE
jgi:hypothetical protein